MSNRVLQWLPVMGSPSSKVISAQLECCLLVSHFLQNQRLFTCLLSCRFYGVHGLRVQQTANMVLQAKVAARPPTFQAALNSTSPVSQLSGPGIRVPHWQMRFLQYILKAYWCGSWTCGALLMVLTLRTDCCCAGMDPEEPPLVGQTQRHRSHLAGIT